jgi:AcrR family transcriptional regulator
MTIKTKNQNEKRNTKEKILETAIDLFSENGVSAVSIRDITKVVGINQSSLYNHFKGKDELMDEIIEKFRLEFGEVTFQEDKIEEQLEAMDPELFFQHHLLSLREKITPTVQKMWKIVYIEQFRDKRARDFVIKEIIGRPAAFYEKAFTIMMDKGLIKSVDPRLLSDEYNYSLVALSLERMLIQTDNGDVLPTAKRMFAHVKFICDAVKK